MSNYYETLGVSKTASLSDIKKSYRRLALKYHPDRNSSDPAAEREFKKISEAYAVLSDPQKRQQYDSFGSANFHQQYSHDDIFRGADFSSIFEEFGFGGRSQTGFESVFDQLFGGRRGGVPKGQDVESSIEVSFQEAYEGCERSLNLRLQDGTRRSLKVKVPKGIHSGAKLRVAGKGLDPHYSSGQRGDLYIRVEVLSHGVFTRNGQDLQVALPLRITEALLGASKEVETPQGTRKIKIPAKVKPGTKVRLKGLGFPVFGKEGVFGNLYVKVEYVLPSRISGEQRKALEYLQEVGL